MCETKPWNALIILSAQPCQPDREYGSRILCELTYRSREAPCTLARAIEPVFSTIAAYSLIYAV